jgi:hypothetical protein
MEKVILGNKEDELRCRPVEQEKAENGGLEFWLF